jgi:hypothetical protein
VTAEARVVHHVAGFVAHVRGFRGAVVFIEDEAGEELFFGHRNLWYTDFTDWTDYTDDCTEKNNFYREDREENSKAL